MVAGRNRIILTLHALTSRLGCGCVEKETVNNTARVLTGEGGKKNLFAHDGVGSFFLASASQIVIYCMWLLFTSLSTQIRNRLPDSPTPSL